VCEEEGAPEGSKNKKQRVLSGIVTPADPVYICGTVDEQVCSDTTVTQF
jgi:hypothetical protein